MDTIYKSKICPKCGGSNTYHYLGGSGGENKKDGEVVTDDYFVYKCKKKKCGKLFFVDKSTHLS